MEFIKPTIDIDAQVALLKQRGLAVADDELARSVLSFPPWKTVL